MRTRAAVLFESPGEYSMTEVELDEPKTGEVLVEMRAAGLCHSDDHMAKGDVPVVLPFCGGHEGAGVVTAVGPGVSHLAVGDGVVTMFVPGCGHCRWCLEGLQNLCDSGALAMTGTQLDGTFRMHVDGRDVATGGMLGTFAEHQVYDQLSLVPIPPGIDYDVASLVSCGVVTGWGSAVFMAEVDPGDVVIAMGVGGLGMNAVQGAAHAGAAHVIAVDPVEFKRDLALKLGATEAFAAMAEAADFARSITNGQGADSTIVSVGVVTGEHIAEAVASIRKAGTAVLTSMGAIDASGIPISHFEISMFQKRLQGHVFGGQSPRRTMDLMFQLYQNGQLKIDELITRRYPLEGVAQGYRDMLAGQTVRGIVDFGL